MTKETIHQKLFELQDVKYRDFQSKLIPSIPSDSIIGVRTPELRQMAKQFIKDGKYIDFLSDVQHQYFEENQIHAFILSEIKDYDLCIREVCRFLPYVDNWATCDQMSPKVFKKYREELLREIKKWIDSGETYTVRFAIKMLMEHFLDEDFDMVYTEMVSKVESEEYYVKMMIAWYFATALAKQYENILPFIENRCLDTWTHNKTIQKAVESYRITEEHKNYLKSLRVKKSVSKTKQGAVNL